MTSETARTTQFFATIKAAGLPEVPREFSVVPRGQVIPTALLEKIAHFITVFDRVTTRDAWHNRVLRDVPAISQLRRQEVCFFSAWDFHLPPDGGFKLIEFNDNGSGFLFAAIISAAYYDVAGPEEQESMARPLSFPAFAEVIDNMVDTEVESFFRECPTGLFLILDDIESLRNGKFRNEHQLFCDILRRTGRLAAVGSPADTVWDAEHLLFEGQPVAFIVNRSTDFFWQSDDFRAVRRAYKSGQVYIAPNPSSYASRSDKRLLEWLALPDWDADLGIRTEERLVLSAHVPETHVVHADNIDMLVRRKDDFVFKPLHGFAGRGLLDRKMVGRGHLRRLLHHGQGYVAQRWVPKPAIDVGGSRVWTDLRVWAYRGQIFGISGRASRRPDRLDLASPGGWLPTYASL